MIHNKTRSMKNLFVVLILSVLLISCSKGEPIGKYQAIEANGNLIIINTTDGSGDVYKWDLENNNQLKFPGDTAQNGNYFYKLIGRLNNDQIPPKNNRKIDRRGGPPVDAARPND
jgi:hypothetical protein